MVIRGHSQKIGCGAHLARLRRENSGKYDVQGAVAYEELLNFSPAELQGRIIPFLKLVD